MNMTNGNSTFVQWLAAGAAAAVLMVFARRNRRHGYQKVRPTESPVQEAMLWLAQLRESLSLSSDGDTLPTHSQRSASSLAQGHTEQLLSLNSALQQYGRQASLYQTSELEASRSADAHTERPAVQA
jgi:hypothetical protein